MKNIILFGVSVLCLACISVISFILYDVLLTASGSGISALGTVAVFIMAVALAVRYLWEKRQAGD